MKGFEENKNMKERFSKKSNTYQKNGSFLDISDSNQEDENLIMKRGIVGKEVSKFAQNLKWFSAWEREVKRVLKR